LPNQETREGNRRGNKITSHTPSRSAVKNYIGARHIQILAT
jgi:hypothetical protein